MVADRRKRLLDCEIKIAETGRSCALSRGKKRACEIFHKLTRSMIDAPAVTALIMVHRMYGAVTNFGGQLF